MAVKPAREWTWKDKVYGPQFRLIVGTFAQFQKLMEQRGEPVKHDDDPPEAMTYMHWPKSGMEVVLWFPASIKPMAPKWIGLIAHEALHATFGVLKDRGLAEFDEAATYYLQWVIEEVYGCLKPKRQPKPKPEPPSE